MLTNASNLSFKFHKHRHLREKKIFMLFLQGQKIEIERPIFVIFMVCVTVLINFLSNFLTEFYPYRYCSINVRDVSFLYYIKLHEWHVMHIL